MRLIDADKLIKDVNEDKFTKYCKQMNVPLDDEPQVDGFHIGLVEGAIYLQPTIEGPQWIPCEKELPISYNSVLLCTEERTVLAGFRNCEGWYSHFDEGMLDCNIIAWMPLPQAYTGKESD